MTYRETVNLGEKVLSMADIAEAKTDAWLLLEMVCKIDRSFYYLHMAEEMPEEQMSEYQIALRKRPVKASELDSAISRIEKQLQVSGEKEVTSKRVGDMVMLELKKLDNVAYVRYGSVYFNCGTLDDMIKLVENARDDQGKEEK